MVLCALILVSSMCSLGFLATILLNRRRVPVLAQLAPRPPRRWPKLSLIVPARNEASRIERALASKLDQDYPELEVIAIDDRSSDDTGALIDRAAARDRRLVAVHIDVLPPGWLGKVHAMHKGIERASGDWILLSDADVVLAPGTLRRANRMGRSRGARPCRRLARPRCPCGEARCCRRC